MLKIALPLAMLAVAAPATAQDMPGAVDLGALSRTQVQSSMAEGYAERGGSRSRHVTRSPNGEPLSARSRSYCEAFPSYRSQYGASDPRVTKLASACRRAGYSY